jgi:antitoxin component YwqK of YwqJK toxin-antitoxin module
MKELSEKFLNGNLRWREVYSSEDHKQVKAYWDTGKVMEEGELVKCERGRYGYRWSDWCEEGLVSGYYEGGEKAVETNFKHGLQNGVRKEWFKNGKQAAIEEYVEGRLTKAKAWDKDGKQTLDEAYEADGSRVVK